MENKVCFMFGHATTPYSALPLIEAAAECLEISVILADKIKSVAEKHSATDFLYHFLTAIIV